MDDDFFKGEGSRVTRRREQRARTRRNRIIALIVVLVAAVAVAAVVLVVSRAGDGGGDEAQAVAVAPSGSPAASPPASPSASPTPTPTPTPSPTPPPLDEPTKKDPMRVYFGGDSLAGLPGELFAQHGASSGLMKVHTDYQVSSRLTNPDPVDWPDHLQSELTSGHPDVGVFMIGINDPGMPMIAKGSFTMYPKKAWLEEYQRRAEKLMKIMLHEGVKRVYWVGLPIMPEQGQTNQVKRLNDLFKTAAGHHRDVVYVDTFDLLADKKGHFAASLRSGDGVHFTDEGAGMIADAVWAAIKADWRPQ
jgi:hypothetical protein